ncbi:hypothetical protein GCM10010230_28930 [Streptomyces narbonensis]|nr:hypothetical protein GCM10010230_28930 [Streptomyces narbonensis]
MDIDTSSHSDGQESMHRIAFPIVASASLSLALLLPQSASAAVADVPDQPSVAGEFRTLGPGLYTSTPSRYRIAENDVAVGLMSRSQTVTRQADSTQAQDAPAGRPDLGVFGPGWTAEFLGGRLNRSLTRGSGFLTTTDLGVSESVRYDLTNQLDRPDGGHLITYTAPDGSTITESAVWDDAAGVLRTTVTETVNLGLATAPAGDDVPVNALGQPVPAADLKPIFTWKQVAGGAWRVTGVGTKAFRTTTVAYDSKGRVQQIDEPARGETPARSVKVSYASATTAAGTALGDVAGRAKDITVTEGATVQTRARYAYDVRGLLRKTTDPASGLDLNAYTYDGYDRVVTATTDEGARWELTYTGDAVAPQARETTGTLPVPGGPVTGAASQNEPEGVAPGPEEFLDPDVSLPLPYPGPCSTAGSWMLYASEGCSTKVAHHGWRNPSWKQLKSGTFVRGVDNDHCTTAPDRPLGYDFRAACDAHDYGYGTIGNSYKEHRYSLSRSQVAEVDALFWDMLYDRTCRGYAVKSPCRAAATTLYGAVAVSARAKAGADAT